MIDERDDHGWYHLQSGHSFPMNQLQRSLRIEFLQDHVPPAAQRKRVRRSPGIDVKKRHGVDAHIRVRLPQSIGYIEGVQIKVTVRQHDALRVCGGAAGIEEFRNRIFINGLEIKLTLLSFTQKLVVSEPVSPVRAWLTKTNKMLDGACIGSKGFHHRCKFRIKKEQARGRILQDIGDFFCAQSDVQGQKNGRNLGNPVIRLEQPMTVKAEKGDAVPGPYAKLQKASRKAVATPVKLLISQTQVSTNNAGLLPEDSRCVLFESDRSKRKDHICSWSALRSTMTSFPSLTL